MEKREAALELLEKMRKLRKTRPHQVITDSLHGEAYILEYISLQPEGIIPRDISREMNISSARVAMSLNRLEEKGLITRRPDTLDRRRILVTVTEKGNCTAENMRNSVLEHAVKILDLLGEQDATEYLRITGKLVDLISSCVITGE